MAGFSQGGKMRAIVLGLMLAGCATTTPIYDREGKPALLVECGPHASSCFAKAQEACAGPYTLLDEGGHSGVFGVPQHGGGMMIGTARRNSIKVRCGR